MKTLRPRPVRLVPLLLLAAALSLPARGEDTIAVAPADLDAVETLDEIIVSGRLDSLSSAWKAVIEAEDRFYARYNELNQDDSMDITCRFEQPTGTRIPKRTCQARYFDEASRSEAMRVLGTMEGNVRSLRPDAMQAELKARTLKLLKTDPQLKRALLERARLDQYYQALRAGKLKEGKVVLD